MASTTFDNAAANDLSGLFVMEQKTLSNEQLETFYHDAFVEDQTRHFIALVGVGVHESKLVTDVGGGCGFFAKRLAYLTGRKVKVIDTDTASIETCRRNGVDAAYGDALNPDAMGGEGIITLNLILHHLVGSSEQITFELQRKALAAWRRHAQAVFVNEYIYESYLGNLSGWLIFQITKSRFLSGIGRVVSSVVPAFRANTFGVGVRFRAHEEWVRLFASAGFDVKRRLVGEEEHVSLPLRLLLIKHIRRDSFLLEPRHTHDSSINANA
jgi:SAM-dependent methyltransferase